MNLPDELLLYTFSHLHAIRSYEPQSEAFKDKKQERARQCENTQRQATLYALTLTSRRFKNIAEPILYNAFINTTTWKGFKPLCLFLRTVSQRRHLAAYVQYAENRLWDYHGNGLYDDMELYGATDMVKDYFDTFGAILGFCSNLNHLSIVSLETAEVSLWRNLIRYKQPPFEMSTHGFQKLETLCLQIHTEDYGLGEESAWFRRISNALITVPTLKVLKASGITSGSAGFVTGQYKSLEDIDISECILDFSDLVSLAESSPHLKRFGCTWAYLNSVGFHLPDLYDALCSVQTSLEHLHLDTREVRFCAEDFPLQPLGSLRDFLELKCVELCESSLLANAMSLLDFPDQKLSTRISDRLPPNIEHLTLLVKSEYGYNEDCRIDEAFALWDLAEDCHRHLPHLKQIHIKSAYELSAPLLTRQFREAGVEFATIKELDMMQHD
ncbi:hypothetical protein BU24DRAFT_425103 [Aaosphaeria arxii CBS 175.79]|uniref:F-box domain-containing protein n=1 Tax=Aaosphaeria arxii CBS 175.79 TaxID=1450172 RepID=A0A6A5XI04_9PLEO|nr:uncharacterized protein BU24DRAFT_425103 [Aaosphaeria arxii CBS 175.79]KAF2012441.1 hypothetical protein BU24DRAFT_425103 [Aaosphaeria arxii CBS 175.79]